MNNTKNKQKLPKRGPKKLYSEKNQNDFENVNKILDQHKTLFFSDSLRNIRSVASWNDKLNKIIVEKKNGSVWNLFGSENRKILILNPEESVFLIETNLLEVKWNNIPMSLQQAYAVLLDKDVYSKYRNYVVYSTLLREGYKVIRHRLKNEENKKENVNKKLKLEDVQTKRKPGPLQPLLYKTYDDCDVFVKHLQIIEQSFGKEDQELPEKIYDCYFPSNSNFCKSKPPKPDFSICSTSCDDILPTPSSKNETTKTLFAMNSYKNVFYQIENVSII